MDKGNKTICIVDDDPNIVHMLSDVLVDEGYTVATATQSLRVFDRAKESHPDLIIMDIIMPHLDGLQQITLLSLDDDLNKVPIIVISARANVLAEVTDLRQHRIVGFFAKPFEIEDFLKKVEEELKLGNFPRVAYQAPEVLFANIAIGDLLIVQIRRTVLVGATRYQLTDTEYRLLVALAKKVDRVVSREDIWQIVWGYETPLTRALDVQIRRLRIKLSQMVKERGKSVPTIVTVRGCGYKLVSPAKGPSSHFG